MTSLTPEMLLLNLRNELDRVQGLSVAAFPGGPSFGRQQRQIKAKQGAISSLKQQISKVQSQINSQTKQVVDIEFENENPETKVMPAPTESNNNLRNALIIGGVALLVL